MSKKDLDWANIGFQYRVTDKRYVSNYKDGAWDEGGLTEDSMMTVSESANIMQYCQEVFEGMNLNDVNIINNLKDLIAENIAVEE